MVRVVLCARMVAHIKFAYIKRHIVSMYFSGPGTTGVRNCTYSYTNLNVLETGVLDMYIIFLMCFSIRYEAHIKNEPDGNIH